MWIARDKDDSLWLYDTKPTKGIYAWEIPESGNACEIGDYLDGFGEVKWSDEEPRELILK